MRVLLTGGAGHIGSNIANALIERGDSVIILDTLHRNCLETSANLVLGDVRDEKLVKMLCESVDSVIHLASLAGVSTIRERPIDTMDVILSGTKNVLEAAQGRVVVFSTSEVYGPKAYKVGDTVSPELTIGEVRWTYAVSKLAAEFLAHSYWKERGTDALVVRPFNIYGPGQQGESVIHNFVDAACAGECMYVNGDGSQIRSFCYISDMVDGALKALDHGEAGKSYNIGNPLATATMYSLAVLIKRLADSNSVIAFRDIDYGDVQYRIPDISKAHTIGFAPKVSLEEGIERTLAAQCAC